jgi:predicted nuclease with TOPRIM domain
MDSNLNILEAKVLEAVGLIQELRNENQNLTTRNNELDSQVTAMEARLGGLEDDNTRLNHELEETRQDAGSIEDYEQKRQEVEDKVGNLLAKLEALG